MMSTEKIKKVLLINVKVIGENSGTGNTLKNLFYDYPNECLFQLCLDDRNSNNSDTINNTLHTGNISYPVDWFFRSIIKLMTYRKKNNTPIETINLPGAIVNKNIKGVLHDFFRGLLDMSFIHINKRILQTIDNFEPDVIYTCGTSIRNFKVVNFFAKRYNIRSVIHIMDDWLETTYTTSFFSIFARKSLKNQLNIAVNKSVINFGISEDLARKYEGIFGKRFDVLMNPVRSISESYKNNDPKIIKLIYAGALTLNRWKSIIDVAEIVQELNYKGEKAITFEIYIPPLNRTKEYCLKMEELGVILNDYVPIEQINDVYNRSDILLHVESFDSNIIPFTKYSLSTKIPEYMAAGKPVLAYLPECLYGFRYIQDRRIGFVASSKDELKSKLRELINNKVLMKQFAENGLRFARNEHSVSVATRKMLAAFKAACEKN